MAFDGIAAYALVQQLRKELVGTKIDKLYQPEKDEITLVLRSKTTDGKLLMSASTSNPRVHFSHISKQNPMSAPMFCMLLRKHLCGGKVIAVSQNGLERCIDIQIESYTELGDLTVKHLIAEIMGRHSNIILTDCDGKILDSIKHIDASVSSVRQILPGMGYAPPPPQDKINPLECEYIDIVRAVASAEGVVLDKFIMQTFEGISPVVAREICAKSGLNTDVAAAELTADMQKKLCDEIFELFEKIKRCDFSPCVIYDGGGKPIDFCAFEIEQYGTAATVKRCDSISCAAEDYYVTRDTEERKKQKSASLVRLVSNNIDRCAKKIVILHQTVQKSCERDKYKMYADLITANLYRIKNGEKAVVAENFYSPECETVIIPLDIQLTPQQNAQRYYKKYSKAKIAEEQATIQLGLAQSELEYLESIMQSVSLASNSDDLEEIKNELAAQGYMTQRASGRRKKQTVSKPMHFVSSDGFDIYVGKNNTQNDYVTTRLANSADWWFHTKGFAGSHTIIKLGVDKEIPDRTMLEAAMLAAYYSSAKESAKVEIDYTQIKNVKKPSGAKPGMVIYDSYNTLYVNPHELSAEVLEQK